MNDAGSRLVFVGNLDSVLFRQRLEHLHQSLGTPPHTILNTARNCRQDLLRFIGDCAWLILTVILSLRTTRLILHGAYSPILWPLVLLCRVRTVSILQGSELNVDFVGIRSWLIVLILRRSTIVACRNEAQRAQVIRQCGVLHERCLIVNWGLKNELFDMARPVPGADPVLISPRATQAEYNIPVIFDVISRLKADGYRLRFVYVRFNPKFDLSDISVADEVLDAPPQEKLWGKIAAADICISVPDYDGLSNTVLETLAVGTLPIYSDLEPYAFLKQDTRLGIAVEFGKSFKKNADNLYTVLKEAIERIEAIRKDTVFRRTFTTDHFKSGTGVERIIEVLRG